jgi:peptidoglycan lytic transglycosylase G
MLLWLGLIVVMVVAVGWALARGSFGDDPAPAREGAAPTTTLLIREGLRREDVAAALDKETDISGERYLALTAPGARGRALAGADHPTSLEGFLFPATYELPKDATAQDLVNLQLDAYEANTADVNYRYAQSRNLTRYDVLIIASMIEREVAVARERPLVASVIYNRLRRRMRLDIDSTVQYAVGAWKRELTAADLAVDSPYNTRRFAGLPPGPIASPGKDSIRAAARPLQTPYLYYVARNDGSGRHYFSATPEQFRMDVQRSRANAEG